MDNWDKTFSKHISISSSEEGKVKKETLYLLIPFPWPMSDRDLVQAKKTWENYLGNDKYLLCHMKSTEDPKYPPKEKPVRAEMVIGGYFLEEKSPTETQIVMINSMDLKVSTGASKTNHFIIL